MQTPTSAHPPAAPAEHSPEVAHALRRCEEAIRQLCGMVNSYAQQLGLGPKVNADDWVELTVGLAATPARPTATPTPPATAEPQPPTVGDSVQISVSPSHHDEVCLKYNGQTGVVEEIGKETDSGLPLFSVRFPDGYRDGFYDDEFTLVRRAIATA